MAKNVFKDMRKKMSKAVDKAQDGVKELADKTKDRFGKARLDFEARTYQQNQEKKWSKQKAKALFEVKKATDAIAIVRKYPIVKKLTEDLMQQIMDLEKYIKETSPEDILQYCDEMLAELNDSLPVSEEGDTDERAQNNKNIEKIYKRTRKLAGDVKKIMQDLIME